MIIEIKYVSLALFITLLILMLIFEIVCRSNKRIIEAIEVLNDNEVISATEKSFNIKIVRLFTARNFRIADMIYCLLGLLWLFLVFTPIACFLLLLPLAILIAVFIYFLGTRYYDSKIQKMICKIEDSKLLTGKKKKRLIELIEELKPI